MKSIILIGECNRLEKSNVKQYRTAIFSFSGLLSGKKFNKVEVLDTSGFNIELGNEYILHLNIVEHRGSTVIASLIKAKLIE